MSTFDGYVEEFPLIRIDRFTDLPGRPRPTAWFLSHIHSDHLIGLDRKGNAPVLLFCSHATARMLLKLTTFGRRLNFERGILETVKRTYTRLEATLRPIPLGTRTEIELAPGERICVTLLDANHCLGAVMFLIEGKGKAILYTGDVRCEKWWVDRLCREPIMVPYANGLKRLDRVYLDTSCASSSGPCRSFETKREGIAELLRKVAEYPADTIFWFHAWTWGYEDVMIALAAFLGTKVHVDRYKWIVYSSLRETAKSSGGWIDMTESAPLRGFEFGHDFHKGCLTDEEGADVRVHCCERGMSCKVLEKEGVVRILPIMTRYKGIEYSEAPVLGNATDMDANLGFSIDDVRQLGDLIDLCRTRLAPHAPQLVYFNQWLADRIECLSTTAKLDFAAFWTSVKTKCGDGDLDDLSVKDLIASMALIFTGKSNEELAKAQQTSSHQITFPYSRHSSYEEMRMLVEVLRPRALSANVMLADLDMDDLFGDLMDNERDAQASMPSPTSMMAGDDDLDNTATKPGCSDAKIVPDKPANGAILSDGNPSISPDPLQAHFHPATPRQVERPSTAPLDTSKRHSAGIDKSEARHRRKISRLEENLRRRHILHAQNAASGKYASQWSDVELISISGYHNAPEEVEL